MDSATSSLNLIERIRRGDREAFSPLFEKYRARLTAILHYRLGPRLRESVEVDDLLQETFLRAYREFDHFVYRSPGSFFRWLSRIAEHVVIDAARFENRDKRRLDQKVPLRSPSNPDGADPADNRTPSRIYAQREGVVRLLFALDALPANYREVILLAKVEGLGTQEIADRLGKSREAASLLLHRALKQLRSMPRPGEPH